MSDLLERSSESALNREWSPNTPIGRLHADEFGAIWRALRDDVPVYVDIVDLTWGSRRNARVYDLQHKAGDWMRVGVMPKDHKQTHGDWHDFNKIVAYSIGEPLVDEAPVASVVHDGITYTVSVTTDEHDITRILFTSNDPPREELMARREG